MNAVRTLVSTIVVVFSFVVLLETQITNSHAQDDKFEGAVWRFTMTPVKKGEEERAGLFRVNGKDLFQKDKPSDPDFKQKIGQKVSGEKGKTNLVFDGMRANRGKVTGIKGKAVVEIDKLGEWHGRFIDGEGAHWELKLSRVQE